MLYTTPAPLVCVCVFFLLFSFFNENQGKRVHVTKLCKMKGKYFRFSQTKAYERGFKQK